MTHWFSKKKKYSKYFCVLFHLNVLVSGGRVCVYDHMVKKPCTIFSVLYTHTARFNDFLYRWNGRILKYQNSVLSYIGVYHGECVSTTVSCVCVIHTLNMTHISYDSSVYSQNEDFSI